MKANIFGCESFKGELPVNELPKMDIEVIGCGKYKLDGEIHRLITLLNKTLKKDNFIFGLRMDDEGLYEVKIYKVIRKDD